MRQYICDCCKKPLGRDAKRSLFCFESKKYNCATARIEDSPDGRDYYFDLCGQCADAVMNFIKFNHILEDSHGVS